MNKDQLGLFIRKQRVRLGLTQKDLAEIVQCRRQAIIELERNQCDTGFVLIEKILNRLGFELFPIEREPAKTIVYDKGTKRRASEKQRSRNRSVSTKSTLSDGTPW